MRLFHLLTGSPFSPDDIINKLIPNGIWPIITQLLTTVVLIIIVRRLLYKPVKEMLAKRAEHVKRHIDEAERDQQLAANVLSEADTRLKTAKTQSLMMLKEAQEASEVTKTEALEEARSQARQLKLQADEEIRKARLQADEDIRREIVDVAIEASRRVLERELVKQDNDKVVDDFVKERLN